MENKPLVSVHIITYNQELTIAETISSVISQNTNFSFEIVIGEDCSTDNTRLICEDFASKYENINLLDSNENLGLMGNFIRTFENCKGKYIALLEGDDYWVDKGKLQKQIDFLEKNQEYSVCHTNLNFLYVKENKQVINYQRPIKSTASDIDLLFGNYTNTPTVVLRNVFNSKLPSDYRNFICGDWALFILHAQKGKVKYLPDVTATYRVHDSLWNADHRWKYRYDTIIQVLDYFSNDYTLKIKHKIWVRRFIVDIQRMKSSIKRLDLFYFLISFLSFSKIFMKLNFSFKKIIKYKNYNPW
ncbi:glycosyltransferase [Flammeovirga sp. EKP202]|uniref:glycosyltransferase family 2 protein n=1 Tax=Flammeovirga sp. EKP202 TaxID=2770592 RepID=UPI00165EDC88|nr:glycosyltransferase [Flammeovirga sp. EKP202]MBD0400835.1 glycosyltransferase [Flammeovirga sp. EKP202]